MSTNKFLLVAAVILGAVLCGSTGDGLKAQAVAPVALSGVVSSQAEGKMEGVLVIARGDGANHTVTVVSDAQGRYSFPRTHISPGKYAVRIRAFGYDLADPGPVEVAAGKSANRDLKLDKTKDLSMQLTPLDWVMSATGTTDQKDKLVYQGASCNYCHSLRRIMRSKHTADQFTSVVMRRMAGYYPDGTASSDDGRGKAEKFRSFGDSNGHPTPTPPKPNLDGVNIPYGTVPRVELSAYLASINLSGGRTTWPYELKAALPRPTGSGTRVIITQWDQPRRDTVSHDADVDSKGNLWYGDESNQFLGMLDPKTNTITEYPMPALPPDHLGGTRDIQVDNEDNIWFPLRVPGGAALVTKFEPKTKKLTTVEGATAQFIALGPDNKMWLGGVGNPPTRIDMKTMKVDGIYTGGGYQVVVSSKGNPYIGSGGNIMGYDVAAGKSKTWPVPTPRPYARRGRMDAEDRYWFAEYTADKIGRFDTKTETFQEWTLPKYSTPYTVSRPDKNGYVYAPSNTAERLMRLDPKTGEIVQYLIPTEFDTKKLALDPSTSRTTVWMANTRNARILRVEMLD